MAAPTELDPRLERRELIAYLVDNPVCYHRWRTPDGRVLTCYRRTVQRAELADGRVEARCRLHVETMLEEPARAL